MKRPLSGGSIIGTTSMQPSMFEARSSVQSCSIAVFFGALLCTLGACSDAVPAAEENTARAALRRFAATSAGGESPAARDFKTFALNALLVPLLDAENDAPARWADPSFSVDCDDAWVTVDGTRPDVNAPVPDTFTVRWQMARCTPLGTHVEVSGAVEMHVEADSQGFSSRIVPNGLTLRSEYGVEAVTEPFTARLPTTLEARPLGIASASRSTSGSDLDRDPRGAGR